VDPVAEEEQFMKQKKSYPPVFFATSIAVP
jgi:hypothetical protein